MTSLSQNRRKLLRQLQHRKGRQKHGLFLAEGRKVVETALALGARPHSLYLRRGESLSLPQDLLDSVPLFELEPKDFASISTVSTPDGVLGVFPLPHKASFPPLGSALTLALEGVQDGGNVGTLLRSACAFGLEQCVLAKGCADPFHPKVVRASMGAVFGMALSWGEPLPPLLERAKQTGWLLVGTSSSQGVPPEESSFSAPTVLILGSEGQGLSPEVAELCSHWLRLPMAEGWDSLNVASAGAICLYLLRKKNTFS